MPKRNIGGYEMKQTTKTLFGLMMLGVFLSACGERFRGDFVGTARPGPSSCAIDPRDGTTYNIRLAGSITNNRANLRVIELTEITNEDARSSTATTFARLFRGFELRGDVVNNETISSTGTDTIFRVRDRGRETLENINDEGEFVDEVTDDYDIVTMSGSVNRARTEVTSFEIERQTRIPISATEEEDCTVSLLVDTLTLEK
jgi:hypothetical protein